MFGEGFVMRSMKCFDAVSAGLFLDGDVAVLSFLTNDAVNDSEAAIVLSRRNLELLHGSITKALQYHALHPATPPAALEKGRQVRTKAHASSADSKIE